MTMIDAFVAPHTVSTTGLRAAAAHRDGVPGGGDLPAAATPAPVIATPVIPARPEPEGADFTTVFDIMGRIFSAV
ncbi:hypothetical protein OHS59_24410 [Streptomyces sp. NBC_00414]|uniref:hypothetical protein n=1 Tax=Streptomyces sp. NBC_00414 TaxID=2975739 RepID=UPI002E1E9EBC